MEDQLCFGFVFLVLFAKSIEKIILVHTKFDEYKFTSAAPIRWIHPSSNNMGTKKKQYEKPYSPITQV